MFHFEREEREIRRRDGKRERELSFHSERKKKEKREREEKIIIIKKKDRA